jgi:hypothetical protein
MDSQLRIYWRDPGYWRWLWQKRVSAHMKGAIAALVAVACAIAGYLSAHWLDPAQERATLTSQRVVTVVRTMRANAAPQLTTSQTAAQPARVRMNLLSIMPPRPQTAQRFEVVARVSFAPVAGSIRCDVSIGGAPYREIRLTWNSPIARCFFRVPDDARGKPLQIRLSAALGTSAARVTLPFTVS